MPRRTVQHVIGDQAVSAVSSIWTTIGAAVEEIRNDYGEDLLIQTTLKEEVDPFKIWVQVKGKQSVPTPRYPIRTLSLSSDHVFRWAGHIDQVIVILWDITNNCGWYAVPASQVRLGELVVANKPRFNLKFPDECEFNVASAKRLVWQARFRNFMAQYSMAWVGEECGYRYIEIAEGRKAAEENARKRIPDSIFVAFALMRSVGFVIDNNGQRIEENAAREIERACREYYEHAKAGTIGEASELVRDCDSLDEAFNSILYSVFLAHIEHFTGGAGLPVLLLDPCMNFLQQYITDGRPVEEWFADLPVD